jgi:hypothetical protein
MIPYLHLTKFRTLLKFGVWFAFVVTMPTVVADEDCHHFTQDGWLFANVCISEFDTNGNYLRSKCTGDQYEDPDSCGHAMCKLGIDAGTCTGSNCVQEPGCTWTGTCSTSLDCCGMNFCNMSTHRCSESIDGGGDGGGGGGSGGWGDGGCSSDWDCFAGEQCCGGSCREISNLGCLGS